MHDACSHIHIVHIYLRKFMCMITKYVYSVTKYVLVLLLAI